MERQGTTLAALIRLRAANKVSVEKIVERVKKGCGAKPAAGYVRWLLKSAKR